MDENRYMIYLVQDQQGKAFSPQEYQEAQVRSSQASHPHEHT